MPVSEILEGLQAILKADGWRGKTNMFLLIGGNLSLSGNYGNLDQLIIAANDAELWDWDTFRQAYDGTFGKRKPSNKPVKLTTVPVGQVIRETDKAWQFSTGKLTNKGANGPELAGVWIPKSQATFDERTGTLELPVWLAVEKKLDEVTSSSSFSGQPYWDIKMGAARSNPVSSGVGKGGRAFKFVANNTAGLITARFLRSVA